MVQLATAFLVSVSLLAGKTIAGQPVTDALLQQLILQNASELVKQIAEKPAEYRLQIIYTQIDRNARNQPSFRNYYYHFDPELYFNPASMVKMPLAFLALEKLNRLNIAGVNKSTSIQFDSSRPWHKPLNADSTSANGTPSIGHFIKKAFLISDNDAYNRMYQWVGQQQINRGLHARGYTSARITRQFTGLTPQQNRVTNPVRFADPGGRTIYAQPELVNTDSFHFGAPVFIGNAHYNRSDSLVQAPFDFTGHNHISLLDLQQMLQSVMFPQSVAAKRRFQLAEEDYVFLRRWLSAFSSETDDPKYDTSKYYDCYVKFFFRDSIRRLPPGVRVFNKVGWSYGFMTDVSYVADFTHGVEYMLAATLYVNSDGVVNDGKYDYDSLGYPFFRQLGQVVYRYELQRQRKRKPDLGDFRTEYGHRNPADTRPAVKVVDN